MLNNLKLENFRQHRDLVIDFTTGINVLKAPNEGGKSTLLEAINYALFGSKSLRTSLDETVTWGKDTKTLKVMLSVTVDGKAFSFSRSKAGAEVVVGGEVFVTGQNEVSAFTATMLGADVTTASKMMFASQNGLRGALEEGPKALSVLIEELSDMAVFDKILETAQEKLVLGSPALLEERMKGAEATLAAASETLPAKPDEDDYNAKIGALTNTVTETEAAVPALTSALESATQAWQAASASYMKRIEFDQAVDAAKRKAVECQGEVVRLTPAATTVLTDSREALRGEVAAAADWQARRSAYLKFSALPEGECLYIGTAEKFGVELDAATTSKASIESAIAEVVNKIVRAKARRINHDKCDKCGQDVSHLTTVIETNAAVDAEIAELETVEAAKRSDLETACRVWNGLSGIRRHADRYQAALHGLYAYVEMRNDVFPAKATWTGPIPDEVGPDLGLAKSRLAAAEAQFTELEKAKTKLEMALEQGSAAIQALDKAELALAECVAPDADTILTLTAAKDEAAAKIETAQSAAFSSRQELETLRNGHANAVALWSACQARVTDAEKLIALCKKDLGALGFNNALVKKLRAIRPMVANKIWNTVLASVSVMFTQMRGESSIVTKEASGFKVNGQAVESLSGSTLDVLGIALRCALLRTFIPQCGLLVLDEPAQGCDDSRTEAMLGFLQGLGMTQTLLVTHETVSESVAENIIQL